MNRHTSDLLALPTVLAAWNLSLGSLYYWAAIVLGAALIAVLLADVFEPWVESRIITYGVVIALEVILLVLFYFVVGLPGWFPLFLRWLGFLLIQGFIAVFTVELLNDQRPLDRGKAYLICALLSIILNSFAWLLEILFPSAWIVKTLFP